MPYSQTVDDPTGNGWAQPAFDPRITNLALLQPNPMSTSSGIERGYIKQAAGNAPGASTQTTTAQGFLTAPRMVTFLYNPSSVSVSHAISTTDAALDPTLRSALDDGQIIGPTGSTVSFSLLFDRTYEVSNPANFGTSLGEKGVSVDVEALYALVGILQLQSASPSTTTTPFAPTVTSDSKQGKAEAIAKEWVYELNQNALPSETLFTIQDIINGTTPNAAKADKAAKTELEKRLKAAGLSVSDLPPSPDQTTVVSSSNTNPVGTFTAPSPVITGQNFGYMTVQPVVVVFGRQRTTWSPTVDYYGYISAIDIEYAHWTQNMVPSRCAISITMTLLATTVDQMTQMATWSGPS